MKKTKKDSKKSKKSKKASTKVKKGNIKSKSSKPKKKDVKAEASKKSTKKEPVEERSVRRDLREELAAAATPQQQVVPPQATSSKLDEIGIVTLSNPSMEGALRKLMANEDFRDCAVKAGDRFLFFENENCVLNEMPHRSEFPLLVCRAPEKARKHAMNREEKAAQKAVQVTKGEAAAAAAPKVLDEDDDEHKNSHISKEALQAAIEAKERKQREAKEKEATLKEREAKVKADEVALLEREHEHYRKLMELSDEELDRRVQAAKSHPLFDKWIFQVVGFTKEDSAVISRFGTDLCCAVEEVWEFERWVARTTMQPANSSSSNAASSNEQKTPAKKEEKKEVEEQLSSAKTSAAPDKEKVEGNLLRPATMDLPSPPVTPAAAPEAPVVEAPKTDPATTQPTESQPTEVPPGQEAAEAEKKAMEERKKKHHAQWARFMRTFNSLGPQCWFSIHASCNTL